MHERFTDEENRQPFLLWADQRATGYEEAAGQGLVAGTNAAAKALGNEAINFGKRR